MHVQKGHKIQIQIQSTWFPLIDLNPQTFVDNIFMQNQKILKANTPGMPILKLYSLL
jgi:predicted acyl esterase